MPLLWRNSPPVRFGRFLVFGFWFLARLTFGLAFLFCSVGLGLRAILTPLRR